MRRLAVDILAARQIQQTTHACSMFAFRTPKRLCLELNDTHMVTNHAQVPWLVYQK